MSKRANKIAQGVYMFLGGLDNYPLWWLGFPLIGVVFAPFFVLGEGSVFPIHDQLDETLLAYVLNAKHLGEATDRFPELLGGIRTSGMQPSAILFVLLYRVFPVFTAFVVQYGMVFAAAFFGMYFCTKELTGSSILAVIMAGCFSLLPMQPVYGLSVAGVPLLLYAFLCMYRNKNRILSFLWILLFALTTHLVLIGYVVLGLWLFALVWMFWKKKSIKWAGYGFLELLGVYVLVNHKLFFELLFNRGDYVSHREELVNGALPFWKTVWEVFWNSAQHADALHSGLMIPIFCLLVIGGVFYRKLDEVARSRYREALAGLGLLFGIALFYGACKSTPVVALKNECTGFLRYFQMERFYWLYPAGWYLEFALCVSVWWDYCRKQVAWIYLLKLAVLLVLLLPTLQKIKVNSYFYMNVNQINNGSGVTGYISWESYYAEELMKELDEAIGRDKRSYRVAHLGMSPAPALMYGFYTADGYSNNYPLEYKHNFRRAIEKELEKNEATAVYFDTWGSRCYLFNGATGNAWMLGKDTEIVYEHLELQTEVLKELECDYIFSCGEIKNASDMNMQLKGYYETETGYWGVWLYEIM